MVKRYYYFVTALPDLLLDEGKPPISCIDFAGEASISLDPEDFKLLNCLRFPFDNNNLVSAIEKNSGGFDHRGSIDEATLTAGVRAPESLPDYMQLFLEAHRDGHTANPGQCAADQLAGYFYESMTNHENPFVREWYRFDLHLRNVVAGIATRENLPHLREFATGTDPVTSALLVGRDEVAESILKSNAPDFGLAHRLPWIERVLGLPRSKAIDFEKGIDLLRWEMAGDLVAAEYFGVENVLAFFVRLVLVERWLGLDAKLGRERIDNILGVLGNSYTVPEAF